MAEYCAVIEFPVMHVGIRAEGDTLVGHSLSAALRAAQESVEPLGRSAWCASSSATATIRTRSSTCR